MSNERSHPEWPARPGVDVGCDDRGCTTCYERATEPVEAADVLDRMANPHPRMWREAKVLFAKRNRGPIDAAWWTGYCEAMAAATGYPVTYFVDKLKAEVGEGYDPMVEERFRLGRPSATDYDGEHDDCPVDVPHSHA